MPQFSIVIATHERPIMLARSIESLRTQSAGKPQIIVVSDVECPVTRRVTNELLSGDDLFVQRCEGSRGPAASRNLGMRLADGDHLIFLDDDDAFGPMFLQGISVHLSPETITFCNHHTVHERFEDGRSTILKAVEHSHAARPIEDIYVKNFIPLHALVYPRRIIGQAAFDPTLSYEDWDFILQAAKIAPLKHADMHGPIVFTRNDLSRSRACEPDLRRTYERVYARHPHQDEAVREARERLFAAAWQRTSAA